MDWKVFGFNWRRSEGDFVLIAFEDEMDRLDFNAFASTAVAEKRIHTRFFFSFGFVFVDLFLLYMQSRR